MVEEDFDEVGCLKQLRFQLQDFHLEKGNVNASESLKARLIIDRYDKSMILKIETIAHDICSKLYTIRSIWL